jgi:NitT/TauT family transport system ATP-binding protein
MEVHAMRSAHLSIVSAQAGKTTNAPAVELRGVSKAFKSRNASVDVLSGVSLSLASGEFLAIVGPSGSGKSTVLNLLAGLDHPSTSHVMCQGRRIDAVNTEIGYLTQHDSLLPWRTVEQNIAVPLEIRGLGRSETSARHDRRSGPGRFWAAPSGAVVGRNAQARDARPAHSR